jgi:hypothetical protein
MINVVRAGKSCNSGPERSPVSITIVIASSLGMIYQVLTVSSLQYTGFANPRAVLNVASVEETVDYLVRWISSALITCFGTCTLDIVAL